MQEYAIFDFDGTLTQLNVDWDSLRQDISVSKLSEIWKFTETRKQQVFEILTAVEISGLNTNLLVNRERFSTLNRFGVLTNNSEKTVATFFNLINQGDELPLILPDCIIGRETLKGPKENKKIFTRGVQLILDFMQVSTPSDCLYIGDQDYELILAKEVGLDVVNALDFH